MAPLRDERTLSLFPLLITSSTPKITAQLCDSGLLLYEKKPGATCLPSSPAVLVCQGEGQNHLGNFLCVIKMAT